MNKRQKTILAELITGIAITVVAVIAMINFKDWVNRSQAIQAMEQLGKEVLKYREEHGSLPTSSHVEGIKKDLVGGPRLGDLQYRSLWIDPESPPDEILVYTEKHFPSSLLNDGYIVLRLNGGVKWMSKEELDTLLPEQQRQMEEQGKKINLPYP